MVLKKLKLCMQVGIHVLKMWETIDAASQKILPTGRGHYFISYNCQHSVERYFKLNFEVF